VAPEDVLMATNRYTITEELLAVVISVVCVVSNNM
jgi:hypothetical protein